MHKRQKLEVDKAKKQREKQPTNTTHQQELHSANRNVAKLASRHLFNSTKISSSTQTLKLLTKHQ